MWKKIHFISFKHTLLSFIKIIMYSIVNMIATISSVTSVAIIGLIFIQPIVPDGKIVPQHIHKQFSIKNKKKYLKTNHNFNQYNMVYQFNWFNDFK